MNTKKQKAILIVKDEHIKVMLDTPLLSKMGYKILLAQNGEKAIDIVCVKKERIDLILMNIDPGKEMDGTDTAREILKEKSIPILFISSHIEKEIPDKTETKTSYDYSTNSSIFTAHDVSIKMAFKPCSAKQIVRNQFSVLNDLYNNTYCGYLSLNPDNTLLHINDTGLKWSGYQSDNISVKKQTEILTLEALKIYTEIFPFFKKPGYINNVELSYYRKDGSLLPVFFIGKAAYDNEASYSVL